MNTKHKHTLLLSMHIIRTAVLLRRKSTRAKRAEIFSRKKCKARAVVGRGEKRLLCDPGSELRLGGTEKRKGEDNKGDGKKTFFSHPLYYLRPSFSLSLLDVTQIRGRIAVSSPPFPLRLVPCIFFARRFQLFLPSSTCVEAVQRSV